MKNCCCCWIICSNSVVLSADDVDDGMLFGVDGGGGGGGGCWFGVNGNDGDVFGFGVGSVEGVGGGLAVDTRSWLIS